MELVTYCLSIVFNVLEYISLLFSNYKRLITLQYWILFERIHIFISIGYRLQSFWLAWAQSKGLDCVAWSCGTLLSTPQTSLGQLLAHLHSTIEIHSTRLLNIVNNQPVEHNPKTQNIQLASAIDYSDTMKVQSFIFCTLFKLSPIIE